MTVLTDFPIADYAAMDRAQLRELVGGFTQDEFMFCLHTALKTPPTDPGRNGDREQVSALLEAAADGFLILGIGALRTLLWDQTAYRQCAAEASRHNAMGEFWRWVGQAQAMTGGPRRSTRLQSLADTLVHERDRRNGGGSCGMACCDPLFWTKRGLPKLDARRPASKAAQAVRPVPVSA